MFRRTATLAFATILVSAFASPERVDGLRAPSPQRPAEQAARPQQPEPPRDQRRTYEVAGEAEAQISETAQTMRLGNQEIRYTAHAGTDRHVSRRRTHHAISGRYSIVNVNR